MHALFQLLGQIADLPSPDPLDRFLFEQPLIPAVVATLVGFACFAALNRQGQVRKGVMMLGLFLAIGGAVFGVGSLVTTDRERIQTRTLALVDRTLEADRAGASELIASDLTVTTINGAGVGLNRDMFLATIARFDDLGITGSTRSIRGASVDGPNVGRVDCFVRVTGSGGLYGGGFTPSVWRFHWRKDSSGEWSLFLLECLSMFGREPGGDTLNWARRLSG